MFIIKHTDTTGGYRLKCGGKNAAVDKAGLKSQKARVKSLVAIIGFIHCTAYIQLSMFQSTVCCFQFGCFVEFSTFGLYK